MYNDPAAKKQEKGRRKVEGISKFKSCNMFNEICRCVVQISQIQIFYNAGHDV